MIRGIWGALHYGANTVYRLSPAVFTLVGAIWLIQASVIADNIPRRKYVDKKNRKRQGRIR